MAEKVSLSSSSAAISSATTITHRVSSVYELNLIADGEIFKKLSVTNEYKYIAAMYDDAIKNVKQFKGFKDAGDYESAYIVMYKFVVLVLEKIPRHRDFNNTSDVNYRAHQAKYQEMRQLCSTALSELERLKEKLTEQYKQQQQQHHQHPARPLPSTATPIAVSSPAPQGHIANKARLPPPPPPPPHTAQLPQQTTTTTTTASSRSTSNSNSNSNSNNNRNSSSSTTSSTLTLLQEEQFTSDVGKFIASSYNTLASTPAVASTAQAVAETASDVGAKVGEVVKDTVSDPGLQSMVARGVIYAGKGLWEGAKFAGRALYSGSQIVYNEYQKMQQEQQQQQQQQRDFEI